MKLVDRAVLGLVVAGTFALVVACSSSSTDTGSSGKTPTEAGADTSAPADSGGGAEAAAKKALGATCTVDGDCASDHCKTQGSGGGGGGGGGGTGTAGTFCTIFCANPNTTPAPECTDPSFSGKCSGMSFCQIK